MFGVANTGVKERLLREADLTLIKALDICHVAEASKVQLKTMSGEAKKGPACRKKELGICRKSNIPCRF